MKTRVYEPRIGVPPALLKLDLSPLCKLLWIVLAKFANKKMEAYPSNETLLEYMPRAIRQIQRSKETLIALKLLKVKARFNPHEKGRQTSNLYTLFEPWE